ncbi:serine [Echinococcus multilocularis]|uniref:Serine n=1 Tax=Echinococcus multilocularis TaxID=6211 RepID=A0A0S4MIE0_ECHMU|nr:serine [Echinococcus multilocularis]
MANAFLRCESAVHMTGDSKLIDRFRAPVRFKRNPRYLPAEAQNHPTLEARPREIHLEPGERMKERLNLINTAPVTCSLQLDTSQMKYFRIGNGKEPPSPAKPTHTSPPEPLMRMHPVE